MLRNNIGAMAAAPFGVVSAQGSMTRERDTSSRMHIRQGKYLLLMPSCVISEETLMNEGMCLQLRGSMALRSAWEPSYP